MLQAFDFAPPVVFLPPPSAPSRLRANPNMLWLRWNISLVFLSCSSPEEHRACVRFLTRSSRARFSNELAEVNPNLLESWGVYSRAVQSARVKRLRYLGVLNQGAGGLSSGGWRVASLSSPLSVCSCSWCWPQGEAVREQVPYACSSERESNPLLTLSYLSLALRCYSSRSLLAAMECLREWGWVWTGKFNCFSRMLPYSWANPNGLVWVPQLLWFLFHLSCFQAKFLVLSEGGPASS